MQLVIGLKGPAGSGKSTVASMLVDHHNFVEVALADVLKRFIHSVFDVPINVLWGPSHLRSEPLKAWPIHTPSTELSGGVEVAWLTARRLLQTLGTEWGQAQSQDVWVRYAFGVVDALLRYQAAEYSPQRGLSFAGCVADLHPHPYAGVVISDVRFHHEVQAICSRKDGLVWEMTGREGVTAQAEHLSEKEARDRTPGMRLWEVSTQNDLDTTKRRVAELLTPAMLVVAGLSKEEAEKTHALTLLKQELPMNDEFLEVPQARGLPSLDHIGISNEVAQTIRDRFSTTYNDVLQELHEKGLPVAVQKPDHTFPISGVAHLEGQPAHAYGAAWDVNVAWLGYVNHLLSLCLSLQIAADNTLEVTYRTLHRKFVEDNKRLPPTARKSLEDIKSLIITNALHQDALRAQQQHQQQRRMLEGYIDTLTRNLTAVSRHITVRGQDLFAGMNGGQRRAWDPSPRRSMDGEEPEMRLPPDRGI